MHRHASTHGHANFTLRAASSYTAQATGPFIRRLLTERQRKFLASLATRVVLSPKQVVYREGGTAGSIYICADGALKAFRELPSGKRRICAFIFADDLFGLAENGQYLNTVQAIDAVACYRFQVESLTSVLRQDAELEFQFLCKITHELRESQRRAILLGRRLAAGRIAMFLSTLDRVEPERVDKNLIPIPMSRSDIADFLGLTLESVSRASARLVREGIMKFEGPHLIRITDRKRLEKLAADL